MVRRPAGHGLLVEVTHTTPAVLTARVDALVAGDPDPDLLTLGDALVNGVPLVERTAVAEWRSRLVPYPRDLAAAVARRHGQIDHFWRWRMDVERDNGPQLAVHCADVAARCLHVACALSGVWWPGAKWSMSLAPRLTVAPPDLASRLRRIPRLPPAEAAAALVDDTHDLVALHLPEVDVARLRAIFRFSREPFGPSA